MVKHTSPELRDLRKTPSNKIEVGMKTTSLFCSEVWPFCCSNSVLACPWRNFVLVDPFKFIIWSIFLVNTHTETKSEIPVRYLMRTTQGSEIATISYCFICWQCARHSITSTVITHWVSISKTSRKETGSNNNFCNAEPKKNAVYIWFCIWLDQGWKRSDRFPVLIQLVKHQTRTLNQSSWKSRFSSQ